MHDPFRPTSAWLLVPLSLLLVATGCNDSERIDLVFSAESGTRLEYVITVNSRVLTRLGGAPQVTEEEIRLRAVQEVVAVSDEGVVDLEITITSESERPRVFEVRLDRTRGLASVDAVQGLPVEALGELGPARLVLLANGLPPDHPLEPGGSWRIEQDLELPEGPELLRGRGRLEGLGHEGERPVARVRADTALPIDRVMNLEQGRVRLSGEERTRARLDYLVSDGTVRRARSVTTGVFALEVTPPPGTNAEPLEGELEVRVESRTEPVGSTGTA